MTNEALLDKLSSEGKLNKGGGYVFSYSDMEEAMDEARKDEAEKIMADVRNKLGPFQTLVDLVKHNNVINNHSDHFKQILSETLSMCKENIQLFKNR